jgi:large repetitive protein
VPTTITFTVKNVGEATARGPWTDQLVLLHGANFASSSLLTTVQRTDDLAVGDSYTVTATVNLPSLPDGQVEIAATTDVAQSVAEAGRFGNNTLDSAAFTTTHPELVPVGAKAPATAVSGIDLKVTWTTKNTGTGAAIPGWSETVTLVQGNTRTVIGTVTQSSTLAAGASVAREVDYALPISLSGAFTIVITVDSGNAVAEASPIKTDNTASLPFSVTLAPYADLAVSNVTAPATTIADPATVVISWKVTNSGTGQGITDSWTDEIIVSASGVLGANDNIVLGGFVHGGACGR